MAVPRGGGWFETGAAGFGVSILVLEYTLGDGYGLHPGLGLAVVSLLTLLAVAAHTTLSRAIDQYAADAAQHEAMHMIYKTSREAVDEDAKYSWLTPNEEAEYKQFKQLITGGKSAMWPDNPDYEKYMAIHELLGRSPYERLENIHQNPEQQEQYQNWLRDMVGDDEVEPTTERHAPAPSEWKLQTRNNTDTGEVYKVWIDQYGRRREVEGGDDG